MEQPEVSGSLVLQSTPSQTSEQGRAFYIPGLARTEEGNRLEGKNTVMLEVRNPITSLKSKGKNSKTK